ncbi:MAG: hypothetical protein KKB50_12145 [Planctomycetes bacterium]|nr:hypothetical protein [Planctomycetota bacterium]
MKRRARNCAVLIATGGVVLQVASCTDAVGTLLVQLAAREAVNCFLAQLASLLGTA